MQFLADVVEDFAEGVEEDMPYAAVGASVFALLYAHRQLDLSRTPFPRPGWPTIPPWCAPCWSNTEKVFAAYAERHKMKWDAITFDP